MHSVAEPETARDTSQSTGSVSLEGVTKSFGDFTAVKDLDLSVEPGEFLSMLGPSGSGKTTVLRMIAGFEDVTEGTIRLSGQDVTRIPPHSRQVNTVFQDYALFPHLTIAENVGYGLKVRGVSKADRAKQVTEALERVRLGAVANRLPHQLSGGQRQRIALARALILRPQVLLLDEPLGALDKQLREEMQVELKQMQREIGITFIFVTHDQEEALTLSDRVAVFNEGKIEQIGTARDVYENPQTEFVARFLGLSNIIPADLAATLGAPGSALSVRPERVSLTPASVDVPADVISLRGNVAETVYTGPNTRYIVETEVGQRIIAEVQNAHTDRSAGLDRGDSVIASFRLDSASRLP